MTQEASAQQTTPAVVDCSGDLNLQAVDELRERLLTQLNEDPNLCVALSPTASFDLSGAQLLESARRSAKALGGELVLSSPASGACLETLQRGGFLVTPEQRAFWLKDEV